MISQSAMNVSGTWITACAACLACGPATVVRGIVDVTRHAEEAVPCDR
jgi:hypothetical protein